VVVFSGRQNGQRSAVCALGDAPTTAPLRLWLHRFGARLQVNRCPSRRARWERRKRGCCEFPGLLQCHRPIATRWRSRAPVQRGRRGAAADESVALPSPRACARMPGREGPAPLSLVMLRWQWVAPCPGSNCRQARGAPRAPRAIEPPRRLPVIPPKRAPRLPAPAWARGAGGAVRDVGARLFSSVRCRPGPRRRARVGARHPLGRRPPAPACALPSRGASGCRALTPPPRLPPPPPSY
jgi:hypothetical protein